MLEYIGNCNNLIDWTALISKLENQQSAYVGPRHDVGHDVPGVEEVAKPLRDAGYKMKNEGGNAMLAPLDGGSNFADFGSARIA